MKHFFGLLVFSIMITSGAQAQVQCREIFNPLSILGMPSLTRDTRVMKFADRLDFPENTTARVFMEYAYRGHLLNQGSQKLNELGLLEPNGGLCATTCMANILGSMSAQAANFLSFRERAPEIVDALVKTYTHTSGRDARFGATGEHLADVVLSVFPGLVARFGFDSSMSNIHLQVQKSANDFQAHRLLTSMKGDSVSLVGVRPLDPAASTVQGAHAIVILKIDYTQKTVVISDPNRPNDVIVTPFVFTQGTNIAFMVPHTFGNNVVEPFQYFTMTRTIHDQQ